MSAARRVNVFGASLLPPAARKAALIRRACELALESEGVRAAGELNVVFVDRKRMLELNKRFLDHDHDTDVIAFNYDDSPEGGEAPFGDVYVSAHQARKQGTELGHGVLVEVLTLVIHGTLHLVGYDDATPRQRAAMFRRQGRLLEQALAPLKKKTR
jgi:rRNA maturation RNase YbeY